VARSPKTQPAQPGSNASEPPATHAKPVTLKELAHHLGLDASTISVVLNDTPGRSIPEETRLRIKQAAKQFDYHPNLVARSFRNRRTLTLGILVPELSDGYHSEVMSAIGDYLMNTGYSYLTAHHRHRPALIAQYSRMLIARGAEGLICIDTTLERTPAVPTVVVAGHQHLSGVTNVSLDHFKAAELTLGHLHSLGHRSIAFMHGMPFSSDSNERWEGILQMSAKFNIRMKPELIVHLTHDISSPELGYPVVQQLLSRKLKFTALVCFNDVAAIGAIRAIRDAGLRVPEDISVIGFDDIKAAAYVSPNLTTIRQPLCRMGQFAAQCIVNRLNRTEEFREAIGFEPELVVRESTSRVQSRRQADMQE
jgi:DNA-binding LacI/PurR family transcriptional regulator